MIPNEFLKAAGKVLTWLVIGASFLFNLKGDIRVLDTKIDGLEYRLGRIEATMDSFHEGAE
ncbi:hypothetical protein [uncultured Mediterranean phage]|jgi:hypothetical protein|nr:hypothetical protein [uncultured Mediterranean phage]